MYCTVYTSQHTLWTIHIRCLAYNASYNMSMLYTPCTIYILCRTQYGVDNARHAIGGIQYTVYIGQYAVHCRQCKLNKLQRACIKYAVNRK